MILTYPLRWRRDALLIRQKARQIAALLRFDLYDQFGIAASAFAVAARALSLTRSGEVCIEIDSDRLCIFARGQHRAATPPAALAEPGALRLEKVRPKSPELAVEDLAWILGQLNAQLDQRLFDEITHQNEEMLALLHALRTAQVKIERLEASDLGRGLAA